jgi:hypothetical protein
LIAIFCQILYSIYLSKKPILKEAIFWYKQFCLVYIKARKDTLVEWYFTKFQIERPTDINSVPKKIKELQAASIDRLKQGIINLNNPFIVFNEETSAVNIDNYNHNHTSIISVILKKNQLAFTKKNEQVQIEINDENVDAILHAIYYLNSHFNFQESKNNEPKEVEDYEQKQIVELVGTQLKVTPCSIEPTIESNTSARLPSESSSKDNKKKNKVSYHSLTISHRNTMKVKMTAEQLGFDHRYNHYRIVSFYNKYVPENIHAMLVFEDVKISTISKSAKGNLEESVKHVQAKSGLNKLNVDLTNAEPVHIKRVKGGARPVGLWSKRNSAAMKQEPLVLPIGNAGILVPLGRGGCQIGCLRRRRLVIFRP